MPGSSYAKIIKSSVKPVLLTDASTQTDAVTSLSLEEGRANQTQKQTSASQTNIPSVKDKKKSTSSQSEGKQVSKEGPVLKNSTLEMMRKDWQ